MVEEMQIESTYGIDADKENTKNNIIEDLINSIDSTDVQIALTAANLIKNRIIGSDRKKAVVIYLGIFERLKNILKKHADLHANNSIENIANNQEINYLNLELETLQIMTSLAKISKVTYSKNMEALFNSEFQNLLINYLTSYNDKIVEASLCCLRVLSSRNLLNYEKLLQSKILCEISRKIESSQKCAEPFIEILAKTDLIFLSNCLDLIAHSGLLKNLLSILSDNNFKDKVRENILAFLIKITSTNKPNQISQLIFQTCDNNVLDPLCLFDHLQHSNQPLFIQLYAAICMANVFKSTIISGKTYPSLIPLTEVTIPHDSLENMITHRTLPTLVRMCLPDKPLEIRTEGILALAKLIELHPDLQMLASYSRQLLSVVSEFVSPKHFTEKSISQDSPTGKSMIASVLHLYAALASNHESIRKKLIDSHNLIDHVMKGLRETDQHVKYAAILCILSLSRSVQLLRTSFQDTAIWNIVLDALRASHSASANVPLAPDYSLLNACLATCANLLLEFSPAKEMLVNQACILAELATLIKDPRQEGPFLTIKLNALWCLLNMTFRAEESLKREVLASLPFDTYLWPLVERATSPPVTDMGCYSSLGNLRTLPANGNSLYVRDVELELGLKVLGILRNICSPKSHLSAIMPALGENILQELARVMLCDRAPPDIKEQAICVVLGVAQAGPEDGSPLGMGLPDDLVGSEAPTTPGGASSTAHFLLASEGLGYAVANSRAERHEQRTLESLIACAKEIAAAAAAKIEPAPERVLRSGSTRAIISDPPSPRAIRKILMEKLKYNLALREDVLRGLIHCSLNVVDTEHLALNSEGEPIFRAADLESVRDEEMVMSVEPSANESVGGEEDQLKSGFQTPDGSSNLSRSEDSGASSEDKKEPKSSPSFKSGLSYTVSILAQQKQASTSSSNEPEGAENSRSDSCFKEQLRNEPNIIPGQPEFTKVQRAALRCLNAIYAPKAVQKINAMVSTLTNPLSTSSSVVDEKEDNKRNNNPYDTLRSLHWKILSQVLDSMAPGEKQEFLNILNQQLFPTEDEVKSFTANSGSNDILVDTSKETLRNLVSFLTWRKGQRSKRSIKQPRACRENRSA